MFCIRQLKWSKTKTAPKNMDSSLKQELSKLLREQQSAIDNDCDPLYIDRISEEVWTLRNKYACGSTWGTDPVFDKWWVKQVAKARNLNIIRQICIWVAVGAIAISFIIAERANVPSEDEEPPAHAITPE